MGGGGSIYLLLHCHHQNESYESHFNVSLIVRDKVTRQGPQTTIFEEKGEPKRNRTEVLLSTTTIPLGQTGPLACRRACTTHNYYSSRSVDSKKDD